ncbi:MULTISPECIES: GLPGLI family protein [unclassified Chryseobacterium]|uniref:GLPGLI family protein n=1 Tax=unclassified Chryseobacterium TaxID=2593645 RepID=UPI000D711C93|nr:MULTISPECIES: GLPGLI family protein [unclassified Chryseobacterium]PWW27115.1 GLPGLI family protein [Chryseobacterium sp. AG844]
MKNIIILFLFYSQLIVSQNKRFIYEYSFIPDSTNMANVVKEFMFLDISNSRSLFYSQHKYNEDSISVAEAEKGKFYIPNADILYKIEKKKNDIFFLTSDYGLDKIRVKDERKMNWMILPDRQKIFGYDTQKASLDFSGRKWIAWFTSDIPVQDGPYKFHGLPGLIVKIEDVTKSHIYNLVGIKSISDDVKYPELNPKTKEIILNENKFRELFQKYRDDPASDTKQLYIQGKIPNQKDSNGNYRTGAEIVREVDQLSKERLKKDNNIIEIDLLKK